MQTNKVYIHFNDTLFFDLHLTREDKNNVNKIIKSIEKFSRVDKIFRTVLPSNYNYSHTGIISFMDE